MIKDKVMTNYNELRKINCNEFTERKGNLTYLSWTYALDILLQHDPMATWEFLEPLVYNDTVMVRTEVTALGKTLKMQLPVMDNRNNAIKSPDARKISDSQMRCLAKNVACFGIGLYIFAGSDLPADAIDEEPVDLTELIQTWTERILQAKDIEALKVAYTMAYEDVKKDKAAITQISKVKDIRKGELMAVQS
ncbi:Single-strand annealing protein SAK3 [uncultured Caudovirales phage]|uniref:Single-strand annealing protein SAK3 n=1 Tax=uncultured Caudovirales phage TaxID=2100421 RepID=A0A6J7WEC9_9CAUD|nr:Single-strand annealing protein SAK3 [uncultured Caudovirales phage]